MRFTFLGILAALSVFAQSPSTAADPAAIPSLPRETVVVTGSFEPLSLDEIDRTVTSIQAREEALLVESVADLLKLDPSIDLRERAPGGVQADLSIRGSNFGQTLVLVNGLRMNDPQSGHHDMDIPVPLEAVSRVETLRGSGSTMYGSDAVAGVVNIVTAAPETAELRLRAAVGSFGINQERGSVAGAAGRLSGQLAASRDFSSGFMPGRDYRNLQASATGSLRTGWGPGDFTLAYMDHPFGADQFYGNFNSWEDTKTWLAGWQQAFGANTSASFGFRRHSDLFVLYRDRPSFFVNRHATESWQGALRRHETLRPSITVHYGVEGTREAIVSSNLRNHERARGAVYAAADFRVLRRFSLSISAREEVYRRFSGEFSPTVAGGVWLSSRWKLRASASRAFRVPSYTDLYYHDPGNAGSPGLRPERAWSYEVGGDWNPVRGVQAQATVFARRQRDGIDYFRLSPNDIWRALNIQNLNFLGIEGSLRVSAPRGSQFDLRYTAQRGTQDTVPTGYTKYTFQYPRQSGVASWSGRLAGTVVVRARLGAMDRLGGAPYAICEAAAASARGPVRPFIQVSNLNNVSYEDMPGVRMPGRSIVGGMEWVIRGR